MKRYSLTEYEQADAEVRKIYDEFYRITGALRLPNWLKSLGDSSNQARGYWEKVKNCLIQGELPAILKELIVFIVSVRNGTPYCTACHAHAAISLDSSLRYEDLILLGANIDAIEMPTASKAALKFASKMAEDPAAMTDADFESLRAAGFTKSQVKEILGVIDVAVMFNTYTLGVQLEIDPEYRPISLEEIQDQSKCAA